MTASCVRLRRPGIALLLMAALGSCTEQLPTSQGPLPSTAKGPSTTGPAVQSTSPASSSPGATLDVRVLGSGFDAGTRIDFGRGGVVGPAIATNRTTFVSSRELVANITISTSAEIALYDVIATTTGGKKGIGTEMFEVAFVGLDLGAPRRGSSEAIAINDRNQIAGYDRHPDGSHTVFVWENGVKTTLPVGGWVRDINEQGWVLGFQLPRSWIWRPSTGVQWIDPPPGSANFQAEAMNDLGQVVGRATAAGAVVWQNGVFRSVLPPGHSGTAYDINNAGVIVGAAWNGVASGGFQWSEAGGFAWVGGSPDGAEALSINDAGAITGWFQIASGVSHAYMWHNGQRVDLGVIAGPSSVGLGVSNLGVIVGRDANAPFRWTAGSGMRKLGSARTQTTVGEALDVNENEWVVGTAGGRATLWKPK